MKNTSFNISVIEVVYCQPQTIRPIEGMTCKTRCKPAQEIPHRIDNIKLVSDTDGTLWELVLNKQSNSACLFPLSLTGADDKLIRLPARQFRFD